MVDVHPDLFAAIPPVELLRLLISKAAEVKQNNILYVDVSRAYFYARSERPTYIKLLAEDPRSSELVLCGKLLFSMYGTRDAAQNWCEEYSSAVAKAVYARGIANPCLPQCREDGVSLMVHGDDFLAVGPSAGLAKLNAIFEKAYKVKSRLVRCGEGQAKRFESPIG